MLAPMVRFVQGDKVLRRVLTAQFDGCNMVNRQPTPISTTSAIRTSKGATPAITHTHPMKNPSGYGYSLAIDFSGLRKAQIDPFHFQANRSHARCLLHVNLPHARCLLHVNLPHARCLLHVNWSHARCLPHANWSHAPCLPHANWSLAPCLPHARCLLHVNCSTRWTHSYCDHLREIN